MTRIDQTSLKGKIRDLPISEKLESLLLKAGDAAGIDVIFVTSGGQPGTSGRSVGSTRHNGGRAADLQLIVDGRPQAFSDLDGGETVENFVTAAAAFGAIGIGAGLQYMGSKTLHVGFGADASDTRKLVWGKAGRSKFAPQWLRDAADRGWNNPPDWVFAGGRRSAGGMPDGAEDVDVIGDHREERDAMHGADHVARFRPLLDFIAFHEGTAKRPGGGYNTSLSFGAFTGGEQNLAGMTLDQIDALQKSMLAHPANHFNSSALGRYQIVRSTLLGLRQKLGLGGGLLYSPALQDRLGAALVERRGRDVTGLRNEWASLKGLDAASILAAYDEAGASDGGQADFADGGADRPRHDGPRGPASDYRQWPRQNSHDPQRSTSGGRAALRIGDSGAEVEALQGALAAAGYALGTLDGKFGNITRGALLAFQADNGLPITGAADAATWQALSNGAQRPIQPQRAGEIAKQLREEGSATIAGADKAKIAAWVSSVLGALGLGKSVITAGAAPAAAGVSADAFQQAAELLKHFASGTDAKVITDTAAKLVEAAGGAGKLAVGPEVAAAIVQINDALLKANHKFPAIESFVQSLAKPAAAAGGANQNFLDVVMRQFQDGSALGALVSALGTGANFVLPGAGGSLAALGIGLATHYFSNQVINARVADHRTGKNLGR